MSQQLVTLRPVGQDDMPFLLELYASTRLEELAPLGWTPAVQAAFLSQQFHAQQRHYQAHYADAAYELVLVGGAPGGRLTVGRWPDELRVVDLALLPIHRGEGIGSMLLRELLAEAAAMGKPVRLHVKKQNRALGLYTRLGFTPLEDRDVYLFLEWRAERKDPQ